MKKFLPLLVLVFTVAVARADQSFTILLDGLQETPPNASPGTGSGTAFFDSTALTLAISVSFVGLVAPSTADHVHLGAPGVPGGILVDYGPVTTLGSTSGTITNIPLAFPGANVSDLLAGNTYLNIHSTAFPGGEIRGQLVPVVVPEPASVLLTGLGLVGLAFGLRRRSA